MQKNDINHESVERDILGLINICRGRVLDVVEAQLGASSNWRIVRAQLLNLFGEKGLSADIERVVAAAFDNQSDL